MSKTPLFNVCNLITNATKEVPPETSFVSDLERCIELMSTQPGKPTPTYKPSSLQCIRQMYFQITEADQDPSYSSSSLCGICESGTDRHLRIQDAVCHMKDYNMPCEYIDVATFVKSRELADLTVLSKNGFETKLHHNKYNLRFLCDGIIKYKSQYYILEIKTESMYKWQGREAVSSDHYLQAASYSLCFGLDKVLFLYENRDTCQKKAFMLNITDDMRKSVVDKITSCDEYVGLGIAPPIPEDYDKKTCKYCAYKQVCKKATAATKRPCY